ncbi:MAG: hypothetical protein P9L94_07450 [Candidatus Hinthialibacter antarcticus]|nr:hypothetical protein [Candidatus Hinthialibacter antarcticus]
MSLQSAHQFDPHSNAAFDEIQTLLPNHAVAVSQEPGGVRVSISSGKLFSDSDLGRLLLINAKYRDNDLILRVSVPPSLFQQLQSLGIERIVWVDEA